MEGASKFTSLRASLNNLLGTKASTVAELGDAVANEGEAAPQTSNEPDAVAQEPTAVVAGVSRDEFLAFKATASETLAQAVQVIEDLSAKVASYETKAEETESDLSKVLEDLQAVATQLVNSKVTKNNGQAPAASNASVDSAIAKALGSAAQEMTSQEIIIKQ